jgi:hypothetical protein
LTVSTSLKPLIQSLKEHTKPPHEDTKLQDFGPFQGLAVADSVHLSTHPTGPPLPLTHYDDCLTHSFPM